MPTFDVSRFSAAPCERVWEVLIDTTRWIEWGPSARKVICPERYITAGSGGRILTALGFWVTFEVTAFDPPRSWSWRVAGVPATGHRVECAAGGGCRMVFEVPVIAAPYALICLVAAGRIARIAEEEERLVRKNGQCREKRG